MDLKIFFSPVNSEVVESLESVSSFGKNISINNEGMPDYADAEVALIGLNENRGAGDGEQGQEHAADEIRKKLYRLKKGFGKYKIVDLGNIRNGVSVDETYLRIKEVCHILIEKNILPILIGGSHDLDYGQYMAYDGLEKLVSILNIDAFLDMEEGDGNGNLMNDKHIHKILLHEPNYLFNYSHLAYQTYLINQDTVAVLEKLYFETYRVGHLRSNISEMEPIIRNADMMSFDVVAIRSGDAPGSKMAQPFGLSGEEACQICWYAGLNEKLSSAGFYNYNPELDDDNKKTAAVVATMVWYFIEGYYHRKNEQNFKTNDYIKFVVSMPSEPETLNFYKSRLSEKWWMEVPYPKGQEKYDRNCLIPCSYSDYENANQGNLPERYITTYSKLI